MITGECTFCWAVFTVCFTQDVLSQVMRDVITVPTTFVSYPGGQAIFGCTPLKFAVSIVDVEWIVNGSSLESLTTANRNITSIRDSMGRYGLMFADIPVEYNSTTVSCNVTFSKGSGISDPASMLILQGRYRTTG